MFLIVGNGSLGNAFYECFLDEFEGNQIDLMSSRELEELSQNQLQELIKNYKLILWCARDAGTPTSTIRSDSLWNRVQFTLLAIRWSGKFIFTSSAGSIYGNDTDFPSRENSRLNPVDQYGELKRVHELQLIQNSRTVGFQFLILRIGNIFTLNERQPGIIGAILRSIQNQESFNLQWGHQTRDFIFLEEVAQMSFQLILKNLTGIFNVASGISYSMFDVIKKFERYFRKDCKYILINEAPIIRKSEISILKILNAGITKPRNLDQILLG